MDECIQVHNLSKSYDGKLAVDHISFQLHHQELCAFLGPNGAGKSTTIQVLTTLLPHDDGEVKIEGYILGKQNETIRTKLGIVFQHSVLDEHMSAYQNLMIRCGLYHMNKNEARQRVQKLCQLCHMEGFAHQRIEQLSGGQRRRVDIARALIPNPKLLILDEPSTGLDIAARIELWQMLRGLKEQGMTIFYSTHDMAEAEQADHIIMIKHGKIVLNDTREALLKQYEKEQLFIYTQSKQQVCQILDQKRIHYQKIEEVIAVEITTFFELMSILRSIERYVHRIELKKGSMEHVYLAMMEDESI